MKKLNSQERQEQIVELLERNGAMKVLDLANYFKVSRETIRRDLITLSDHGSVTKYHGCITRNHHQSPFSTEHPNVQEDLSGSSQLERLNSQIRLLDEKLQINAEIKMKICQKALTLIPPNASIFLDNGSTTLFLAQLLNQLSGYSIITSSIQVINTCLNGSNQLIMCGGAINTLTFSSTGILAADFLKKLNTNVAFMGSEGFLSNGGPTGNDLNYRQVKQAALEHSDLRVVLADSSKGDYSALAKYADWKDIDYLITDSNLDPELRRWIEKDTRIIFADEEDHEKPHIS